MIRVYIADDHQVLLDGLHTLLSSIEDIDVVGIGHNGREAVAFLQDHQVDVMLLDINMPDMNGIDACKIISKDFPSVKIVALSMYNKASFIQQMLKSGASGYILKNTGQEELVSAIRTVHSGEQFLGPMVSKTLMASMLGRAQKTKNYIPELTRREKEILALIAKEHTTQEISGTLNISLNTVETHRKNLLSKFGVRNSVGLVKIAMERGLLE
jgi:DNA-binding NarL/FixJ family response regulator